MNILNLKESNMQKPSNGWDNQKKSFKKPNPNGNKKPFNKPQQKVSKDNKPKEPEVKIITGDPEKLYIEAFDKLVDWVFPTKEGTTKTLIMNRLFGKNDKGFLIEEKAKSLLGVHDTEGTKVQDKLVATASAIRNVYKAAITSKLNRAELQEEDLLLIFNSISPLVKYRLIQGTPIEEIYNAISDTLTRDNCKA